jgi:2-pyrone-4,6-dicarboxylate lactonase
MMTKIIAPFALPPLSCDCHTHVFGPAGRFPVRAVTNYEPPDSPFERHALTMQSHGLQRAVLIQPVTYQTDNSAILDAIARSDGRLKGVGVLTGQTPLVELESLRARGLCGLRFIEMTNPNGQGRYQGSIGVEHLAQLAPGMRELKMHAQIWATASTCVALVSALQPLGLPLVFDHMAGIDVSKGVCDADFQALLRLLAGGGIWIKLTVCRVSKGPPNEFSDVRPFHEALVHENPERLLWGSDFPFVRLGDRAPEFGQLIELFAAWTPGIARRRILVDNPAQLFGFSTPPDRVSTSSNQSRSHI